MTGGDLFSSPDPLIVVTSSEHPSFRYEHAPFTDQKEADWHIQVTPLITLITLPNNPLINLIIYVLYVSMSLFRSLMGSVYMICCALWCIYIDIGPFHHKPSTQVYHNRWALWLQRSVQQHPLGYSCLRHELYRSWFKRVDQDQGWQRWARGVEDQRLIHRQERDYFWSNLSSSGINTNHSPNSPNNRNSFDIFSMSVTLMITIFYYIYIYFFFLYFFLYLMNS